MDTAFHVSTTDQLSYVDAKVWNLLADDTVTVDSVAVVVDSPAVIDAAAGGMYGQAAAVLDAGAALRVCSNALSGADASLADLPAGAEAASSGVGELTRLQGEEYAHIRP